MRHSSFCADPSGDAVVVVAAAVPFAVPASARAATPGGRASARYRLARATSCRASHSGAKSISTPCRKKPSHVLSPRPPCPTRFIPSFQSPAPKSGRPCAPAVVPRSMARTQCSNSVPSSVDTLGQPVRLVLRRRRSGGASERARARRARRCRRSSARTRPSTYGSQSRSSEQRLRSPRPDRLVPPVLHVALDELPAGRAQQVRARQVRPREASAPSRPAADRGSRRRRRAGSSRRASTAGS